MKTGRDPGVCWSHGKRASNRLRREANALFVFTEASAAGSCSARNSRRARLSRDRNEVRGKLKVADSSSTTALNAAGSLAVQQLAEFAESQCGAATRNSKVLSAGYAGVASEISEYVRAASCASCIRCTLYSAPYSNCNVAPV